MNKFKLLLCFLMVFVLTFTSLPVLAGKDVTRAFSEGLQQDNTTNTKAVNTLGSNTVSNSQGNKISGYVCPDCSFANPTFKSGFSVEIMGIGKSSVTNENGYFEIPDVPANLNGYVLKVKKSGYLCREIYNITASNDVQLGSEQSPVYMWAGDMVIGGTQDGAINLGDIMEVVKGFNTTLGNSKYNPNYDFNGDNAVNISDIMIMIKHFNTSTYSYPYFIIPVITTPPATIPVSTSTSTATPTNTPTPTNTATSTPTNTPIPTNTATYTPTNTPAPTYTPTVPPVPKPDLVITDLVTSLTSPTTGDTISLTAKVKNNGSIPSGKAIRIAFMKDGMVFAYEDFTRTIEPGETRAIYCPCAVAGLSGSLVLSAVVDTLNTIDEIDENNNTISKTLTVGGLPYPTGENPSPIGSKADLTVMEIVSNPATISTGSIVTFSARIKNIGGSATPVGKAIKISFIWNDEEYCRIYYAGIINPGQVIEVKDDGPIPISGGTLKIGAIVDCENVLDEINETNNSLNRMYDVQKTDLTVTELLTDPAFPKAGDNVTLIAKIKNTSSNATPNEKTIRIGFTSGGVQFDYVDYSGVISSGQTIEIRSTKKIVVNTDPLLVGTTVDAAKAISESDEDNNSLTKTIFPNGKPDLVVAEILSDPVKPVGGNYITLTARIKNNSTVPIPVGQAIKVSFSDSGFNYCTMAYSGGIGAGQTVGVIADTVTAASPGLKSIEVTVDPNNTLEETNESNNSLVRNFNIFSKGENPDKLIDLTTTDINYLPDDNLEGPKILSVNVKNIGKDDIPEYLFFRVKFVLYSKADNYSKPIATFYSNYTNKELWAGDTITMNSNSLWSAPKGIYRLTATVDDENLILETDEGNNSEYRMEFIIE